MRLLIVFLVSCVFTLSAVAQSFHFALVTDTHIGGTTSMEDLERTVQDLNRMQLVDFAIFSGDITEFGSDEELEAAHEALKKLQIPWYIVPGNHDTNWSESGGNSFLTEFGSDVFSFEHQGVVFIGTGSGPYLRMAPGQVPREHLVWLDSVLLAQADHRKPIIFVNHYPLDDGLNNWYEVIDRLKQHNIQLSLCGHGHSNRLMDFEGIPGVMSRANVRANDSVGAYQIVHYDGDEARFTLRYPGVRTAEEPWVTVPLKDHEFYAQEQTYPRPDYSPNETYASQRSVRWTFQDDSDLGAGSTTDGHLIFTANTAGQVYALDPLTGQQIWSYQTQGKIYSTPEVHENTLVVGSADHHIYGLEASTGAFRWKVAADKAVLGTPLLHDGTAYIGASDGVFRAIDLQSGNVLWTLEGVKNYVSAKPLYYQGRLYFGSWGNDFYALDPQTGEKLWEWSNGSANRMLSPAACYPVGSNGRVFIVAPDRYMTALDAATGEVIWRENQEKETGIRVRESMGLSEDGSMVYVKTMDGNLYGISTTADRMEVIWQSALQLPYELAPTAISAGDGIVFVPSHSGLLSAVDADSGEVLWQSKLSNAMINPLAMLPNQRVVASTMDGVIQLIDYSDAWIRINQLGYTPNGIKQAVWAAKSNERIQTFSLIDAHTGEAVFFAGAGQDFGAYGPFESSYRLDFSAFTDTGRFYLQSAGIRSPTFRIAADVYRGAADFALRYMRQQRSGFNPYLQDSCHVHDGYTMYGPMPDSTRIDVSGGWHDASDYLQYSTTSANATYHLLAAYRDFGEVFSDGHQANGLEGSNGVADVLDEARWGLEWLLKMHPRPDWMFNQLADDRDHSGFRLPNLDLVDYGMGPGGPRPVYFITGEPQGLGEHRNRATGTSSTAGKFASAFALAAQLYGEKQDEVSKLFAEKAQTAYNYGLIKPGVSQTAPNLAPYFYEEDNWVDDMQLGAAALWQLSGNADFLHAAKNYGRQEAVTPWLGADTARHYQWYPFHNFGHYELARKLEEEAAEEFIGYYREGIARVWVKAEQNAFYRGVPFIWCSNNLTTSFTIQAYLYRQLSNDETYAALEQANFDWLFGCNPWGTSMVYGLPAWGDTPTKPHSSLTLLHGIPLDGGLVDGPVYGSIFNSLRGVQLEGEDAYAAFQSDLAVYHDDFGDYSTNEPTMDGTASLIYLLAAKEHESREGFSEKK